MGYHKPMKDEGKLIDEPLKKDVLFGRSSKALKHSGNMTFRNIIAMKANEYNSAISRPHKTLIVVGVVDMVTMHGGRFLKEDTKSKKWIVVDRSTALNKTGHCMRDKVMKMQKSGKAKKAMKRAKGDEDRNYPGMPVPRPSELVSTDSYGTSDNDENEIPVDKEQQYLISSSTSRAQQDAPHAHHQPSYNFASQTGVIDSSAERLALVRSQAAALAGLSSNSLLLAAAAASGLRRNAATAQIMNTSPLISPDLLFNPHSDPSSFLRFPFGPSFCSPHLLIGSNNHSQTSAISSEAPMGIVEALISGAGSAGLEGNAALERLEQGKKELIEATKQVEAQKAKLLIQVLNSRTMQPVNVTSIEIDTGV
eukprot:CAMPEP_0202446712 /NCGR_PEP_ID=MMETSP1360-20130828/5273_1 /ASSEMBLY_ACC=CAM_ASM_000848 /TAXON_ID=515479 /ORGANISM="Licmophora paradoxa, Strain CCMP2313" /LENGTH=365 /DNA_ID=CAMNT_0049063369 /DNA_START=77 /DNA_END=1174 /DNA_ORIENTATION=-